MSDFTFSDSVHVEATPAQVYGLVSDITRMGEWSPVCTGCWWDEGDGPSVGAQFTGRNEVPGRTWETRSTVVVAEPEREFAWEVGDGFVRWGYAFAASETGTELTESWEFLPAGLAFFRGKFGDTAEQEINDRTRLAHDGIPLTLAAIKAAVES